MSDQTELLHLLRQKTTDATYPITLVEKIQRNIPVY